MASHTSRARDVITEFLKRLGTAKILRSNRPHRLGKACSWLATLHVNPNWLATEMKFTANGLDISCNVPLTSLISCDTAARSTTKLLHHNADYCSQSLGTRLVVLARDEFCHKGHDGVSVGEIALNYVHTTGAPSCSYVTPVTRYYGPNPRLYEYIVCWLTPNRQTNQAYRIRSLAHSGKPPRGQPHKSG